MDPKDVRELKALISLTDEPDEKIFSEIIKKILLFGPAAIPYLEETWETSFDTETQHRILNIIHKIQVDKVALELDHWAKFNSQDLFSAYLIITRFHYPDIKEADIKKKIEDIKQDIWLELNEGLTALEKIKVVNHILFDVYDFQGNTADPHSLQNLYLNTLLDIRKGSPLSLGILYIIIAQQLGLPVYGVNLPEHFVLAYTNELTEERLGFLDKDEVLFYINPFSKGSVFSKKEVELFIKQLKIEPQEKFFKPCSNSDIIRRFINNLIYTYDKLGHEEKVNELETIKNILLD